MGHFVDQVRWEVERVTWRYGPNSFPNVVLWMTYMERVTKTYISDAYRVEFDPNDREMCSVMTFNPMFELSDFKAGKNSYVNIKDLPDWMLVAMNTIRAMDSGPNYTSIELPQGSRIDEHTFWLSAPNDGEYDDTRR